MTDNELICLYLQNNLSEFEKIEFEERLEHEPELMEEYKFQKELREALVDEEVMELRAQCKAIGNKNSLVQHTREKIRFWGMAMVAGFLLIISSMLAIYQSGIGFSDPGQIFTKYYKPYESVVSVRSEESMNNKLIRKAFNHYSNGRWQKSEDCLKKVIIQETDDAVYKFYLGIVELELGNINSSIQAFNETIKKNNALFNEQAYWYSGLAYLKKGELRKAQKRFEWLVQRQGYRYRESRDILKTLDGGIFSR
ncbi:MAG: hypothetical protein K9H65_01900 [Bacteroidales bacterium]|nr:hypothetical protein [Bacteroidales bacterium]